jgi:hypothetical protein
MTAEQVLAACNTLTANSCEMSPSPVCVRRQARRLGAPAALR